MKLPYVYLLKTWPCTTFWCYDRHKCTIYTVSRCYCAPKRRIPTAYPGWPGGTAGCPTERMAGATSSSPWAAPPGSAHSARTPPPMTCRALTHRQEPRCNYRTQGGSGRGGSNQPRGNMVETSLWSHSHVTERTLTWSKWCFLYPAEPNHPANRAVPLETLPIPAGAAKVISAESTHPTCMTWWGDDRAGVPIASTPAR